MVGWVLEITDRKQGRCCCLVREPPKSLVSQSAMFYSVIQRATTVMGNSQFLTLRWENSRVGKVPLIPVLYRSLTNSRRKQPIRIKAHVSFSMCPHGVVCHLPLTMIYKYLSFGVCRDQSPTDLLHNKQLHSAGKLYLVITLSFSSHSDQSVNNPGN